MLKGFLSFFNHGLKWDSFPLLRSFLTRASGSGKPFLLYLRSSVWMHTRGLRPALDCQCMAISMFLSLTKKSIKIYLIKQYLSLDVSLDSDARFGAVIECRWCCALLSTAQQGHGIWLLLNAHVASNSSIPSSASPAPPNRVGVWEVCTCSHSRCCWQEQ